MNRISDLQLIVDQLQRGDLEVAEIAHFLHHPSALVRTNALDALRVWARIDDQAVSLIVEAAKAPENRQARLQGTMTVAHVAVACLFRVGSCVAAAAGNELVSGWEDGDRGDLIWYLDAEGLRCAE